MNDGTNKTTILVVDDDYQFCEYICDVLKMAGYAVLVASDVESGKVQYRFRHPDLILTDLSMPGQEGGELIDHIREKEKDRPIIAMSGGYRHADHNLEMAEMLGANAVLGKPFSNSDLLATIEGLLEP